MGARLGMRDRGGMSIIVRGLGIGLAATIAYLLLTLTDDGEGGANIGAGLAVFAVLAVGGFAWGLRDGLGRHRGRAAQPIGLQTLVLRWTLAPVISVAIVVVALVLRHGADRADLDASSTVFLVLLALVPSLVGVLIGHSARSTTTRGPEVDRVRT